MKLLLHDVSVPDRDPVVDKSGHLTRSWWDWFGLFRLTLQSYPTRNNTISRTAQTASISATDLSIGSLAAGAYRVSYYLRTTTADLGATVLLTLTWTDGGTLMTHTSATVSGNAVTNYTQASVRMCVDAATAIQYATTFAAEGLFAYKLCATVEHIPGPP